MTSGLERSIRNPIARPSLSRVSSGKNLQSIAKCTASASGMSKSARRLASDVSRLSFCRDRSQSAALAADQVNDRRAHGGCGDQLSLLDDAFIAGLMVGAFVQQCFEAWPLPCLSLNVPWMLN